jgi:hypothetical protein
MRGVIGEWMLGREREAWGDGGRRGRKRFPIIVIIWVKV